PFKGRMNVLEGKNNSIIIDDSYNANPVSVIRALEFLSTQKGRKIAVLGTMGELGDYEKKGHEEVGEKAAAVADILVTVGETAEKYIPNAASDKGMNREKIKSFSGSDEAGDYLKKIIREGDVILLKGSQNAARMERAVAKILKDPEKASKLLVRQSDFWKTR
ncbi:MAG: cyanophycin synthetase, partial [Patescibacteria group bacterium]|nr:cyanophycin synthetase [Patescibacteria group bacterium]